MLVAPNPPPVRYICGADKELRNAQSPLRSKAPGKKRKKSHEKDSKINLQLSHAAPLLPVPKRARK